MQEKKELKTTISSNSVSRDEVNASFTRVFNKNLEEARNNIRIAADEAKKDIPRYTKATHEYQEQTFQSIKEISDSFIESQKEIINSIQTTWLLKRQAEDEMFAPGWFSLRYLAKVYVNTLSRFVENTVAAVSMANNTVIANIESLKMAIHNTRNNTKEISRLNRNFTKTLGDTFSAGVIKNVDQGQQRTIGLFQNLEELPDQEQTSQEPKDQ